MASRLIPLVDVFSSNWRLKFAKILTTRNLSPQLKRLKLILRNLFTKNVDMESPLKNWSFGNFLINTILWNRGSSRFGCHFTQRQHTYGSKVENLPTICSCFTWLIDKCGPLSEVVLYRCNPWSGWGKPRSLDPVPKIRLIYESTHGRRTRY